MITKRSRFHIPCFENNVIIDFSTFHVIYAAYDRDNNLSRTHNNAIPRLYWLSYLQPILDFLSMPRNFFKYTLTIQDNI